MPFEFITDPELRQKAIDENAIQMDELKVSMKSLVETEVNKATEGIKRNHDALLDEKKKLQDKFKGITDPLEALEALKIVNENPDIQLLKEGKFEEVVQKRVSIATTELEDQLKDLDSKLKTSDVIANKYKTMFTSNIVEMELRNAAIAAGVVPEAIEDALNIGRHVFALAEDEKAVEARDSKGKLLRTADDKVLTPSNWVESLRVSKPHYWGKSKGAGLNSGGSGAANDLEVAIQAAATSKNAALYRQLRAEQKKLRLA